MLLDVLSQPDVSDLREQSTGNFFRKSFFLVVWVADGHIQDCLLQALVFTLRMGLDHECGPCLEALWRQAWDVRPFLEVVQLHQVMLCPNLTEQS